MVDDQSVTSAQKADPAPTLTATIGVVSAVLAPVVGVVALVVFVLLGRGIAVDTANVRGLNQMVTTARVVVPVLALFGAAFVFLSWGRARLSAGRQVSAGLLGLNLLVAAGFGLFVHARADIFEHSEQRTCSMGARLLCTLTVTNAPTSTVTLHWTGVSDPPGAVFRPDSGTLAPGETSPEITIRAGFGCPVTFILDDAEHGKQVRSVLACA